MYLCITIYIYDIIYIYVQYVEIQSDIQISQIHLDNANQRHDWHTELVKDYDVLYSSPMKHENMGNP
jgi:hypothetical protein